MVAAGLGAWDRVASTGELPVAGEDRSRANRQFGLAPRDALASVGSTRTTSAGAPASIDPAADLPVLGVPALNG